MRVKTLLMAAALSTLSAASAHAQYWGGGTTVIGGPGLVSVGSPYGLSSYSAVYGNPYATTVVVQRPAVVAAPAPLVYSPGVTVVRPGGWGWGPGIRPGFRPGFGPGFRPGFGPGFGPRPYGWGRW